MPQAILVRVAVTLVSFAAALTTAVAQTSGSGVAEPISSRPIRLLVGFPPGGAIDAVSRLLAEGLRPRLGRPIFKAAG
jgi:tripartite-type tricarboxylate transporter receptor subunit TctC